MRMRDRAPSAPKATVVQRRAARLAVLALLLLLAACGQARAIAGKKTTATVTSATRGRTPAPGSTASVTMPPTPANSPFVCANPAGSALTYAFVNADRQIYMVSGCSAPVQLTHLQFTDTYTMPNPIAWSPSRRYLAIHPNTQQDYCLQIIDTSTGATLTTQYDCYNGDPTQNGDVRGFVGWIDDNTFLGRIDSGTINAPTPVTLARVDIHTRAETPIASFAWMSDQRLRAGSVFFGGRVNPSDTVAYLFRLSLADGSQTRLVNLGLSGNGGCQAGPGPCSWTAPWDVSPDGAHILFHNPGADSLPSDTHMVPNTPIYYANADGSGAVAALTGVTAQGMTDAVFDPTGTRATAYVSSNSSSTDFVYQSLPQGALQRLSGSYNSVWRADGQALVDVRSTYSGDLTLSTATLVDLATGQTTPLPANTTQYLWAS